MIEGDGREGPASPGAGGWPQGRPEMAVGAIVVDDERLLLVRRATDPGRGRWSLPGGRVEWGETLAHAVVREVLEETGLECVVGQLVGWVERISAEHHFVIFDFEAHALSEDPPNAGDDASEVAWVPLHQVPELDLVAGLLDFLADNEIIETL